MSNHQRSESDNLRSLPELPKNPNSSRPLPIPPKKMVRSLSRHFGKPNRLNATPSKSATTDSIPDKKNMKQKSHNFLPPPLKKGSSKKISFPPKMIMNPKKMASPSKLSLSRHKSVGKLKHSHQKKVKNVDQIPVHRSNSPTLDDINISLLSSKSYRQNDYNKISPSPSIKSKNEKRLSLDISRERNTFIVSTSFMDELNNIVKGPYLMSGNVNGFDQFPPPPPPPPLPPQSNKRNPIKKEKSKKDAESLDLMKRRKKRGGKAYVKMNLDYYKEMIDLLILNGFMLIRLIDPHIKRKELEKVSKSFLSVLSYKEVILDYIKTMIRMELEVATQEGTLFRTNNICTGIMSSYSMRIGKQYLIKVLKPCFEWLMESTLDFEIDPNVIEDPEIVRKNIFNLNYLANKFFKSILNSVDIIPFEIREISNTLQQAVIKKFPNSLYSAVGGFFFLRFVVPAVINPECLDILEGREFGPRFKRPLTLVAKILQQIANNQKFNEPHMEPLNDLIRKLTIDVHKFFNSLVQKDKVALEKERERVLEKMKDQEEHKSDEEVDYRSFLTVHRILYDHIDFLSMKISEEKSLGYDSVTELKQVFEKMGELPDDEKKKKSLHHRATAFFGKIQLKLE